MGDKEPYKENWTNDRVDAKGHATPRGDYVHDADSKRPYYDQDQASPVLEELAEQSDEERENNNLHDEKNKMNGKGSWEKRRDVHEWTEEPWDQRVDEEGYYAAPERGVNKDSTPPHVGAISPPYGKDGPYPDEDEGSGSPEYDSGDVVPEDDSPVEHDDSDDE